MGADSAWRSVSAPNKVCGVLWGFCRIYKQFLVVELVEALASSLFLFLHPNRIHARHGAINAIRSWFNLSQSGIRTIEVHNDRASKR